ncbi:uncharacterized protein EV154DRAFT_522394 [Mucor mucedo]|uniref:uncharacterized protein n=1 Tax=Mucor mucedo TaxID=29922 RepID=UPI002220D957|nr:uncharacterized protein EV154DRAFT_522394 [Mucor mucedo]KAI7884135.1 hypothetical protein EV154DRAFT_522394 [Mucor mucedo]
MGLFSKLKSPAFGGSTPAYAPPSPPRQPNNPDPRILPSGWISQFDPSSQKFFYVYTPTGLRQWEHPADKPFMAANRGYPAQQPGQGYTPQPQYGQPQYGQPQYGGQPQYVQQPMGATGSRMGGGGGGMGMGTMAAMGVGGGLMGYMIGDAISDSHQPDIIENNYYDNDGGGFDDGGGGFDDF